MNPETKFLLYGFWMGLLVATVFWKWIMWRMDNHYYKQLMEIKEKLLVIKNKIAEAKDDRFRD